MAAFFAEGRVAKEKFLPGRIVATPGVLAAVEASGETPIGYLARHIAGDWGDLSEEDKAANELSLREGFRILSAYHLLNGTKIWIITEAANDQGVRESTTILLPDEY